MEAEAHALIIYSELKPGFCAGADLRELVPALAGDGEDSKRRRACGIFWSAFIAC